MLTYHRAPDVVSLIRRHCSYAVEVAMKSTHHIRLPDLVITRDHIHAFNITTGMPRASRYRFPRL